MSKVAKKKLTLDKAREAYQDLSGKASEISRQLGFAGIALIWVFKVDDAGNQIVPPSLILPGILIFVSLALDLAQYTAGSLVWGTFSRIKETKGENEFFAPGWINWPMLTFFWAKLAVMIGAYVFLIRYLVRTLA